MNKDAFEKVIARLKRVRDKNFDMDDTYHCIGGHARKALGLKQADVLNTDGFFNLMGLTEDQANAIFFPRFNGVFNYDMTRKEAYQALEGMVAGRIIFDDETGSWIESS